MSEQQLPFQTAQDCPCLKKNCQYFGNCVECVGIHRRGKSHLPQCMQPLIRDLVEELARKVEFNVSEGRPV